MSPVILLGIMKREARFFEMIIGTEFEVDRARIVCSVGTFMFWNKSYERAIQVLKFRVLSWNYNKSHDHVRSLLLMSSKEKD